jgi:hypothetical protein
MINQSQTLWHVASCLNACPLRAKRVQKQLPVPLPMEKCQTARPLSAAWSSPGWESHDMTLRTGSVIDSWKHRQKEGDIEQRLNKNIEPRAVILFSRQCARRAGKHQFAMCQTPAVMCQRTWPEVGQVYQPNSESN